MKEQQVIEVLKTIDDPELGMDVWSLGLIYEVKVIKDKVLIKMTFTTPMCPYGPLLIEMIKEAVIAGIEGIKEVEIDVVFEPPWKPPDELRVMFGV